MKRNHGLLRVLCAATAAAVTLGISGCKAKPAQSLTEDTAALTQTGTVTDEDFEKSLADFGVELLKTTNIKDKNTLISPVSVMLALGMTQNGADAKTLYEMQNVLGGFTADELNKYLCTYVKNLTSDKDNKLNVANSIWVNDSGNFKADDDFLGKCSGYYGASVMKTPFNSGTKDEINNWVKEKTDGMIGRIINETDVSAVMYLVNALAFDAKWQDEYLDADISDDLFYTQSGNANPVNMMSSFENVYLSSDKATGFVKDYSGQKYSFAALLPRSDVPIDDYINSLTGEEILNMLNSALQEKVDVFLPEFTCTTDLSLKTALSQMGMPTAFLPDEADFSKLGSSDGGNIYTSDVIHSTYIDVTRKGTRAAAATVVSMKTKCAEPRDPKTVTLDRPFVYMIIDKSTNTPVFLGAVKDIGK